MKKSSRTVGSEQINNTLNDMYKQIREIGLLRNNNFRDCAGSKSVRAMLPYGVNYIITDRHFLIT